MRKIFLLIIFGLVASVAAFGDACGSTGDTLADYIALGSCTLTGTDLTFSDFSYTLTGSAAPDAMNVTVVPTIDGAEAGFVFKAGWFAFAGGDTDADIDYNVSCDGCDLDDWVLEMGGVALASDAFANIGETSPDVSPGLAVGATATSSTLMDSAPFAPVGSLTVDKDLTIYGGSTPTSIVSKVSSITNLFSTTATTTTPEPALALLCLGAMALIPIARRRFVR